MQPNSEKKCDAEQNWPEKRTRYMFMVLSIYYLRFFSSSEFFQIKKMRSYKQLAETNVVKMKNSSTGTVRHNKKNKSSNEFWVSCNIAFR